MAKNLVIMESGAKCKTVSKYLGKDFEVVASVGHCVDLPQKKIGVDLNNDFNPTWDTIPGKGNVLKSIVSKAKKAKTVYLMSDPDREGEAISWHIANQLPKSVEILRVATNDLSKEKILEAFDNPRDIDLDMVASYETRRILDRLVGFKCSYPVKRATGGPSVGRVQSASLRILAERELEIKNFKPEKYWAIE